MEQAAIERAGFPRPLLRLVPPLTMALPVSIGVLAGTLQEALRGPLVLGPLLAFAVAISHLSYLGLGALFWSLVIGTATSWLLERPHLGR